MENSTESRMDTLIGEIESSDSPIGPVLRNVYETDGEIQFRRKLDEHSKSHELEIERMCNFHYQGFVESVSELIRVRSDAKSFKIELKEANAELQESGDKLLEELNELSSHRVRNRNIAHTIEALSMCIPVLEMYAKLYEQKKNKRYYPALKTLEQLEHAYLARIKNFRFAELMISKLPTFRENIKDAAKEDLMLFLESIRANSEKLGEIAMKQAHEQYSLSLLHGIDEGFKQEDQDLELCCTDLVDFSPVYRCLHIFSALGERETFEHYYRKERMQQARLAFDWQRTSTKICESLHLFQSYFNQIVGFFVVEDHVMNTTEGLVTRGAAEELWEMAVSKIGTVLADQCSNLEDVSLMLLIKELVVWFSHTLSSYGFGVNALYDVLLEMREQYNEMLAKSWRPVFDKIGKEDNYTPLYISSKEEYSTVIEQFPQEKPISLDAYPKCYPFSLFVPKIYDEVKKFIKASMEFNLNLNISRTETDNSIRKSTNLLLTKTLTESIKKLLSDPSLNLAQLAQMSVNTLHLENSCPELEKFISQLTGSRTDLYGVMSLWNLITLSSIYDALMILWMQILRTTDVNVSLTRLYGSSAFKDIRGDAEMRIYEKLNLKIDEFMGLASYNWTPTSIRMQPSSYIMDLIAYLQGAFITFEPLPNNVAKTACMSSCKHLASGLKLFLLDEKVPSININGILSFDVDLKQCEEFASTQPVEGFEGGLLELSFQDLRQLIDLFTLGDWSTYLHDYGSSSSKYNRTQPKDVILLLEKMTDSTKKINFKKADRERKKFMESLMKKLKDLN